MTYLIVAFVLWVIVSAGMMASMLFRLNELDKQVSVMLVAELQRQQVADYHSLQAGHKKEG